MVILREVTSWLDQFLTRGRFHTLKKLSQQSDGDTTDCHGVFEQKNRFLKTMEPQNNTFY